MIQGETKQNVPQKEKLRHTTCLLDSAGGGAVSSTYRAQPRQEHHKDGKKQVPPKTPVNAFWNRKEQNVP